MALPSPRQKSTSPRHGEEREQTRAVDAAKPSLEEAVGHKLIRTLATQLGALRAVFRAVDAEKNGFAPRHVLRQHILSSLFLGDVKPHSSLCSNERERRITRAWHEALDSLLAKADPKREGIVEFGRLTRLIRAAASERHQFEETARTETAESAAATMLRDPAVATAAVRFAAAAGGGKEAAATTSISEAESSQSTQGASTYFRGLRQFSVRKTRRQEDEELRERFRGVRLDNRGFTNRLSNTQRLFDRMPPANRTSSILGDPAVSLPWAVIGDDVRMEHIVQNLHRERSMDLKNTLKQFDARGNGQLTCSQLLSALHKFDPFIHDAEVFQYYESLSCDAEVAARSRAAELRATRRRERIALQQLQRHAGKSPTRRQQEGCVALVASGVPCAAPPRPPPEKTRKGETRRPTGGKAVGDTISKNVVISSRAPIVVPHTTADDPRSSATPISPLPLGGRPVGGPWGLGPPAATSLPHDSNKNATPRTREREKNSNRPSTAKERQKPAASDVLVSPTKAAIRTPHPPAAAIIAPTAAPPPTPPIPSALPERPVPQRPSTARARPEASSDNSPRAAVSLEEFFNRYGQNVVTTPALRCSAEFTLKWDMKLPRPPSAPVFRPAVSH